MAVHCVQRHAFVGHELFVEGDYTVQAFELCFVRLLAIHVDEQVCVHTVVLVAHFVFEYGLEFVRFAHVLVDHADVVAELPPALLLECVLVAVGLDFEYLFLVREPKPLCIHGLPGHTLFVIEQFVLHLQLQSVFHILDKGDLLLWYRSFFAVAFVVALAYLVYESFYVLSKLLLQCFDLILFLGLIVVKLFNAKLIKYVLNITEFGFNLAYLFSVNFSF